MSGWAQRRLEAEPLATLPGRVWARVPKQSSTAWAEAPGTDTADAGAVQLRERLSDNVGAHPSEALPSEGELELLTLLERHRNEEVAQRLS